MMINHLIAQGFISSTDNKWMMVKNHFTRFGKGLKPDSLANDSNHLYQYEGIPKGWAKLKGMIDETLGNFV